MKNIALMITDILLNNSVIDKENRDSCAYGLEIMLTSVGEFLFILLISIFFKRFFETIVYFLAFIPLRVYAGGYHANGRVRCFAILIAVFAVFLTLLNVIPQSLYIYIAVATTVINLVCVMCFAPIENVNKPLNNTEKKYYKKISNIIVFVECGIVILLLCFFRGSIYLLSFTFGEMSVFLSILAAEIKSLLKGGKEYEKV